MSRLSARYAFMMRHTFTAAVTGNKLAHGIISWMAKRNLRKSVRDPQLRAKLTPDYKVGCKRLIFSSTFYEAMQRENVYTWKPPVLSASAEGRGGDERRRSSTSWMCWCWRPGSTRFNFMRPMDLTGRDGLAIDEAWAEKVQAYRSVCIPGFPNFFLMLGPNTPIGNYSVIAMSEVQSQYVLKLIDHWRQGSVWPTVEATEEAKVRFNSYLKGGHGQDRVGGRLPELVPGPRW